MHSAFVPERSNGVDLKSIVETLVGSNPTGRDFCLSAAKIFLWRRPEGGGSSAAGRS